MIYTLPIHEQRKQVCRHMFLSTLGVTERQIRTALKKRQRDGQIAMEGRGGRREAEKVEDEEKTQSILDHINTFPRMESHYCRANTKNEFLAPELNPTTMYNMHVSEMAADKIKPASRSLYNNIFKFPGDSNFLL
ncbi:elongation factor 4 [Plakobranchus ocellatus]|uniref:Elongation factor 4 n=1 Tax=Plakobranchus ocellatus TaxID=259542 RepID=A0AAV4AQ94_9GAST|nr:elongation factor 4 [Plakobranchus ocellatus]